MIILGVAMILFGAAGACKNNSIFNIFLDGGRRKNNCLLFVYSIGTLIGALVFIGVGIMIGSVKSTIVKEMNDPNACTNKANENVKWLADLDSFVKNNATAKFGQTGGCKVYVQHPDDFKGELPN